MSETKSRATLLNKCFEWTEAAEARESGIYPFFHPLERAEGTKVII